jgi:hypothetical protein
MEDNKWTPKKQSEREEKNELLGNVLYTAILLVIICPLVWILTHHFWVIVVILII